MFTLTKRTTSAWLHDCVRRTLAIAILVVAAIGIVDCKIPSAAGAAVLGDDYPYRTSAADKVDRWSFFTRNCTSFAAWRLNNANGFAFSNSYGGIRWSHAKYWDERARQLGIPVNNSPAVGAVAQSDGGTYGHVAWVAEVGNGTVTIEEYNATTSYGYGRRTVSSSSFEYIHFKDLATPAVDLNLAWTDHGGTAFEVTMTQIAGGWEMFHIGTDNRVFRKINKNGQSTGWQEIAGPRAKKIAVARSSDGRAEFFYIGLNNRVYHHWESTPGGAITNWEDLGGNVLGLGAARAGDKGWEVFTVGTDHQIYRTSQWSRGWTLMPGTYATEVAAATNPDGRVELFHIGGGGKIFHSWQSTPGGGFGGWVDHGGNAKHIAAAGIPGGWELYHVGTDNRIYRKAPAAGIAGYQAIAGTYAQDIAAATSGDGTRIELIHITSVRTIKHAWQQQTGKF